MHCSLRASNPDIVGALVIIDIDSYIKEANRQLSDKASYKNLWTQHCNINNRMFQKQKVIS